ncbi:leucoanthocyanidin dioxygenase, partial [Apiospora sp. TS-2023a]
MADRTKYVDREIPQISLACFDARLDEITSQLCAAAEHVGFFAIVDHGIAPADVSTMFALSERFFALPDALGAGIPDPALDGRRARPQGVVPAAVRREHVVGLWLGDEHLPGFRDRCLAFMHRLQRVSERLMVCLARGLGFADDEYFVQYHDASKPGCQSVMRLLHYFETPKMIPAGEDGTGDNDKKGQRRRVYHRAGAHADWGFLTLLFEKEGQSGLEICPGRDVVADQHHHSLDDAAWSKVHFVPGSIVCNIGDLLMSWSDDRFKSTFHRVKAPPRRTRRQLRRAVLDCPCKEALIQGPLKKHPLVTGEEFNARAMSTHFAALQARLRAKEEGGAAEAGTGGGEDRMKNSSIAAAGSGTSCCV